MAVTMALATTMKASFSLPPGTPCWRQYSYKVSWASWPSSSIVFIGVSCSSGTSGSGTSHETAASQRQKAPQARTSPASRGLLVHNGHYLEQLLLSWLQRRRRVQRPSLGIDAVSAEHGVVLIAALIGAMEYVPTFGSGIGFGLLL